MLGPKVPVYAYQFDDRNAPSYFPPVSFPTGAYHTADIQFLFPFFHGGPLGIPHPLSQAQQVLADQLKDFWTTFARTGNPNGGAGNRRNYPWPRYNLNNPLYLSENTPESVAFSEAQFSREHKCDFWDSVLIY